MTEFANIARSQARKFFWPGATREDVEQEALLALCRHQPSSPQLAKTIIRRHLIEQVRRETQRRPQCVQGGEADARSDTFDLVQLIEERERLRAVLNAPLSDLERAAVGRTLRGEPCYHPYDNALYRARRKLAA